MSLFKSLSLVLITAVSGLLTTLPATADDREKEYYKKLRERQREEQKRFEEQCREDRKRQQEHEKKRQEWERERRKKAQERDREWRKHAKKSRFNERPQHQPFFRNDRHEVPEPTYQPPTHHEWHPAPSTGRGEPCRYSSRIEPRAPRQPQPPAPTIPAGLTVEDAENLIVSPYAPDAGYIDTQGLSSGTEITCPFTNKPLRVP
jgi:hypothetical protein